MPSDWRANFMRRRAFDDFRGEELDPGPACTSDDEIDSYMSRFISSHYHPVGTCKMGTDEYGSG